MSNKPSDYAARQQALDPTLSFAVTAPAGSGKTELLTQRVLSLLAVCDKPEEVLAITFTLKAAGEMRERVISALQSATNSTPPEEAHKRFTWELARKALQQDQQKQWQLLEQPNRLRMQTIDGFCRFLSRQQPVTSKLGTLPDTLDESQSNQAMQRAYRETLTELNQSNASAEALSFLLAHFDNDAEKLQNLTISMLQKREQWLSHLLQINDSEHLQHSNQILIEYLLSQCHEALQPWQANIVDCHNHLFETLQDKPQKSPQFSPTAPLDAFPSPQVNALAQWKSLLDMLFTKQLSLRKPGGLNIKIGLDTKSPKKAEIKALFDEFNQQAGLEEVLLLGKLCPSHPIGEDSLQFLQNLQSFLLRCTARLKLIYGELGATDFTEVALAAREALGNEDCPTDLSLKLEYRIKHILIDEFQDTSHLQYDLLSRLIQGWQADDNHSLFIVGDAMQSCYGFRNADVRIFLQAIQSGINGYPLQALNLQENFRSKAGIVEWNNQVFNQAFPKKQNLNLSAVPYKPSTPFKPGEQTNAVSCNLFSYQDDNKDTATEQEAEYIVRQIQNIRDTSPDESITILIRGRSHAASLLPHLKQANIPWQAVDMDSLQERMVIVDLLSLSRAMLYPSDELAWHALLRSPVIGLNLNDITLLRGQEDSNAQSTLGKLLNRSFPTSLSQEAQQILHRVAPHFEMAWQGRYRKPLRSWIEGLWYSLAGPAVTEPRQQKDCEHFFVLLEQFSHNGQINDWPVFRQAITRLYANDTTQETDNPVQIMTMHKSKGLEFDHVFLPALARAPNTGEKSLLLWNNYYLTADQEILMLGTPSRKGAESEDSHYTFLKSEHHKKSQYEKTRLLYVACTRAIKKLYLSAVLGSNDKGEIKSPADNTMLAAIWPAFDKQANVFNSEKSQPKEAREQEAMQHFRRLSADYALPDLPRGEILSIYRGKEIDDDENIPENTSRENLFSRLTGTIIHETLQYITELGIPQWQEQSAETHQQYYSKQLSYHRLPSHFHKTALQKIQQAIDNTLNSETGQWLLNNQHKDSHCELELLYRGKTYIIDRTFINTTDNAETRWIIDYKSATPSDGESLEDFLAVQEEKYRKQLENYRFIFSTKEKRAVKTALYFPLIDQLHTIELH